MKRITNAPKYNRFGRGNPTFICMTCGRRTRDTGQGVDHLCMECYEIAGLDNHVNDGGYKPGSPEYAEAFSEAERYLAKAVKLGGDATKIRLVNTFLWLGY